MDTSSKIVVIYVLYFIHEELLTHNDRATTCSLIQYSPFVTLCLGSIRMDDIISELCYKGTI